MITEPSVVRQRTITEVGRDVIRPGEEIHMRINNRDVGEESVGKKVGVAVLCEQFGHVLFGSFMTVGPNEPEFVNCKYCLEAMHA